MHSFTLSRPQIVGIISALFAEELSRNVRRHVDAATAAAWGEEKEFGPPGIGLSEEELSLCAERVAAFFGIADQRPQISLSDTIGGLASLITNALHTKLEAFAFTPAGDERNCVHRADQIFADAAAAANLFHGRRRFLSLVAPHSLLGFALTILTPNLQRLECVDTRALTPQLLGDTLAFGDVLIATPTSWRYILQQGVAAPDNVMGAFFGEPMSAELSNEMRQAGFGAQREIYGSTETGLIGWRDSPTDPFVLFDHWRRDDRGLRRQSLSDDGEAVTPMDQLEWESDRRFHLGGRRDGAVQIGAINVFPERIAEILSGHDLVDQSVIKVGRHSGGVNRLIAHIKLIDPAPPSEATVRAIDRWCRKSLRPQERPCIFHFEETLDGL